MAALTLMIQGTTSDAGKSALVTGLCRIYRRRGKRVAPFKPQNMALNSAVTVDGGEIGRAQAVQAQACGLQAHTDMNPVLLKPNTDIGAQVIVHGKAVTALDAMAYHDYKPKAMKAVIESFRRLVRDYDMILVEGAGSPAEINLRDKDIANMGFAEQVDCPVVLVADIDRGGVFAHIIGTLALLGERERDRVLGFVINRFRGDLSILQPGIDWLERETGKCVFGVVPYLHDLHLEAEDALPRQPQRSVQQPFKVVVPRLPRISNHTDFDPLRVDPRIEVSFVGDAGHGVAADLIVLPGSKCVRDDIQWLRENHWEAVLLRHLRYGGKLIGICGGFQMLGGAIHDPDGLEGPPGSAPGFGLLCLETTLQPEKQLRRVRGKLSFADAPVEGYEIHAGITSGKALDRPAVFIDGRLDGALSGDAQILGTYVHGLFDANAGRAALLRWAGLEFGEAIDYGALREAGIDRMADAVEEALDLIALERQWQRFAAT